VGRWSGSPAQGHARDFPESRACDAKVPPFTFGIRSAGGIIAQASDAVAHWRSYAEEQEVPGNVIDSIGSALDERRASLGM